MAELPGIRNAKRQTVQGPRVVTALRYFRLSAVDLQATIDFYTFLGMSLDFQTDDQVGFSFRDAGPMQLIFELTDRFGAPSAPASRGTLMHSSPDGAGGLPPRMHTRSVARLRELASAKPTLTPVAPAVPFHAPKPDAKASRNMSTFRRLIPSTSSRLAGSAVLPLSQPGDGSGSASATSASAAARAASHCIPASSKYMRRPPARNGEYLVIYTRSLQRQVKRLIARGFAVAQPVVASAELELAAFFDPNGIEVRLISLIPVELMVPSGTACDWFSRIAYYAVPSHVPHETVAAMENLFASLVTEEGKPKTTLDLAVKLSPNVASGMSTITPSGVRQASQVKAGFRLVDYEQYTYQLHASSFYWMGHDARSAAAALCLANTHQAEAVPGIRDLEHPPPAVKLMGLGFEVFSLESAMTKLKRVKIAWEGTVARTPGLGSIARFSDSAGNAWGIELLAVSGDGTTGLMLDPNGGGTGDHGGADGRGPQSVKQINANHLRGHARSLSDGALIPLLPDRSKIQTQMATAKLRSSYRQARLRALDAYRSGMLGASASPSPSASPGQPVIGGRGGNGDGAESRAPAATTAGGAPTGSRSLSTEPDADAFAAQEEFRTQQFFKRLGLLQKSGSTRW
ncbi:hypothetical protein CXG81DRAFT_25525 [Caulochytrium protostelioides]|uniref:Uncharacterized protein n=1 Tax=Caulochytrium protostelioides TaxID=1555241 RepID=A0A4P9X9W9_9FUNG|nr:hypothetical protein CXG81DRAFT_25525 [Caulochytrium protostelioides]|eukprot:RKP01821.1 hypothetical protein CXG81DRAFT_25525 [Caulochytrium protostelioides]